MIVEVIPSGGVGQGRPLVLDAAQIVIRQDNGTPISVAAHYGPDGAYACSMVGVPDFARMLKALGINMTVVVDRIVLPGPPPGAKLLLSPRGDTNGK